jgi:hypothetical protein
MNAARTARLGTTEQEVVACLQYLRDERGLKPGTTNGPHHWAWFPTTVWDYFDKLRTRDEVAQ